MEGTTCRSRVSYGSETMKKRQEPLTGKWKWKTRQRFERREIFFTHICLDGGRQEHGGDGPQRMAMDEPWQ